LNMKKMTQFSVHSPNNGLVFFVGYSFLFDFKHPDF
jgi:hypothetical protein